MKKLLIIGCILLIAVFSATAQNVYTELSELPDLQSRKAYFTTLSAADKSYAARMHLAQENFGRSPAQGKLLTDIYEFTSPEFYTDPDRFVAQRDALLHRARQIFVRKDIVSLLGVPGGGEPKRCGDASTMGLMFNHGASRSAFGACNCSDESDFNVSCCGWGPFTPGDGGCVGPPAANCTQGTGCGFMGGYPCDGACLSVDAPLCPGYGN